MGVITDESNDEFIRLTVVEEDTETVIEIPVSQVTSVQDPDTDGDSNG